MPLLRSTFDDGPVPHRCFCAGLTGGGTGARNSSCSDDGLASGVSTAESEELKRLRRENAELRRANEILKTASAFFAAAELDRHIR